MKTIMSIGELRALCELAWGERVVVLTFEQRRVRVRVPGRSGDLFAVDLDETEDGDGTGAILARCAEKLFERAVSVREMVGYYREKAQDAEQHAAAIEAKVSQIQAMLAKDMEP